jgi:hypothetical protein
VIRQLAATEVGFGIAFGFDGGAGRPPLACTRIDAPSKTTSTVPSRSVRYVRLVMAFRRSIVDGAG